MKSVTLAIAFLAPVLLAGVSNAKEPGYLELMKVRKACSADITRFCNTVEPGKGRIMMCLQQHLPEVSKQCTDAAAPYSNYAEKLKSN
jgi:hypothetical protein